MVVKIELTPLPHSKMFPFYKGFYKTGSIRVFQGVYTSGSLFYHIRAYDPIYCQLAKALDLGHLQHMYVNCCNKVVINGVKTFLKGFFIQPFV